MRRLVSLLAVLSLATLAAPLACDKDKGATESPGGSGAASGGGGSGDGATEAAGECDGNCSIDFSPKDLGLGIPEADAQPAIDACKAKHKGDERCDAKEWVAGKDAAVCLVCQQEVDVKGGDFRITLEYSAKFGHIYWVFRSPATDGRETIHWVGADDGVYKGPWTLKAGTNP